MVVSKIFGICLKLLKILEPNSGNLEDRQPDVLGTDEPEEGRSETKFSTKGEITQMSGERQQRKSVSG